MDNGWNRMTPTGSPMSYTLVDILFHKSEDRQYPTLTKIKPPYNSRYFGDRIKINNEADTTEQILNGRSLFPVA